MPNPTRDTASGRIYNDLRNLARRTGAPTDQVMLEYLLERFLYRVSIHPLGQQHFVLKGGLLLITRHHLDGDELTTALRNTASHRGIRLRPLSEAISDLPTRRQAPYTAWRRRQGHATDNHPATFADLVATVTAFADPLAAGTARGRAWDPATRTWQAT